MQVVLIPYTQYIREDDRNRKKGKGRHNFVVPFCIHLKKIEKKKKNYNKGLRGGRSQIFSGNTQHRRAQRKEGSDKKIVRG